MNIQPATNQSAIFSDRCDACSAVFNPKDMAIKIQCQHNFHIKCLSDRIVEQGNTCPKCKVRIENGNMLPIPEHKIDTQPQAPIVFQNNQPKALNSVREVEKNYKNLDEIFADRNFECLKNQLSGHNNPEAYLYKCKKIILEDIQNQQTENIINTLKLLNSLRYCQKGILTTDKMLINVLEGMESSPYKDTMLETFAMYVDGHRTKPFVLNLYMEQRAFTKAETFILQHKKILSTEIVSKILLEDIKNKNINNIKGMLNLLTSIFSHFKRQREMSHCIKQWQKNLEDILEDIAERESIEIISLFLEYDITTSSALEYAVNYYINQRDFNSLKNILGKFYVAFPLESFVAELYQEIRDNNIHNIAEFLKIAYFMENKIWGEKIKKSLEVALEDLAQNLGNVSIIDMFLNHNIVVKSAINLVLQDAIETANFNKAQHLIIKYKKIYNIKVKSELFKHALQKNISQQNIENIDALLKLRNLYDHDEAEVYKMNSIILDLLRSDSVHYNIDITNVFIENNIALEEMLSHCIKHYMENIANDTAKNKVTVILRRCNDRLIVDIFKELLQNQNDEEIGIYIDLVANIKTQNEFTKLNQRFTVAVLETQEFQNMDQS